MPSQGAFAHLVVGRVVAIAGADESQALFDAMRSNGHWLALPPHGDIFWKNLQPIAIDAGGGAVFITLSSQDEMHSAPVRVGDYVRYSPHIGRYETPPSDKLAAMYWGIDGCVAVLCRASDRKCVKHYASGVYRTSDGMQLSSMSLLPLKHGVVIDTETMVPTRTR